MKVLVVLLFVSAVYAKNEEYIGWKSYVIQPSTSEDLRNLQSMVEPFHLDFLMRPSTSYKTVVLVRPEYQENFTKGLDNLGIKYGIHSDNVKATLELDDAKIAQKEKVNLRSHPGRKFPYDNYQSLAVIDQYLIDTAANYPETVTLVNPGRSFEGRPMYYLKVSTSNFDGSKPVIIIDGTVHAREWISPPSVTYAIHKLVENVTESELLENFDWIIFPMVNPDGYEFSYTRNRFWRKTRSTDTSPLSYLCPGVDINRNFDFHWMLSGSSSNPCEDIYAGNQPFSEVESRILRDVLHENLNNTAMYLTIHSFGFMILHPWGHDGSFPSNAFMLRSVGVVMADAINTVSDFENYTVGNSAQVLNYVASGASEDYAHSIGIPLTYTYELPGFSNTMLGFVVDPALIDTIVKETWEGITAGAKLVKYLKMDKLKENM